jgi:hypothetical protein
MAQQPHEYLIEQLQFTGDESVHSTSNKIKLNFNHPCKELVWVVQPDSNIDINSTRNFGGPQWFNYTDGVDPSYYTGTPSDPLGGGMASINANLLQGLPLVSGDIAQTTGTSSSVASDLHYSTVGGFTNPTGSTPGPGIQAMNMTPATGGWKDITMSNVLGAGGAFGVGLPLFDSGKNPVLAAKLQLNGHDRFSEREGRYFNLVQPFQHHENIPATGINVYSFGLKPEEHQPSGTCNMSRIDNATLQLTLTREAVADNRSCKVRVYATNYNVLRIMSGMGGLAYSN